MQYISAKSIVSSYAENNYWFGSNYNINIYKGCCHGCIYCDSRSECYGIDDFDTVRAKENALSLIDKELKSKRKTGVVGTGAMSDPYNPFEKELCLTRQALELIDKHGFGVSIITKSDLIIRDIDILQRIKEHSPVLCKITITVSNDELCRRIEPNVSISSERFLVVKKLTDAGIFAGVLLMPVLPFIADNEENIRQYVRLASESGARFIYPAFGMTLRANQRDYFYKKLGELFPSLKEKYIRQYGNSYECQSPNARNLYKLLSEECKRHGILYKMDDIITGYKSAYESRQMTFF